MEYSLVKEANEVNFFKISEDEILNNKKIKVYRVGSKIDIYNEIAKAMANKLKENNRKEISTSFILPVGPRGQYKRFARICNTEKISCRNLITINMDEYLDDSDNLIPEKHSLSFRGFMKENLFHLLDDNLKIRPENIFFPDPNGTSQIEKVIDEIGGVDICFGGVGINGHIAFNEPVDEKLISVNEFRKLKTRMLSVSGDTIIMNSLKYGGHTELIPRRCITIGMAEIFMARELKFYLEYDWQSAVLRKAIFERLTPSFPATFPREHKNSTITVSENVLRGSNTKWYKDVIKNRFIK
ncbi:glucosamine-6-phosphate isomerase [Candidatus Atribacteria bacterium HGW-Atribacteria-1]|nr:MAG: glucosamine-6-phosphate isomerase [Candidatus Atribacteria bacterium HGW-Atribacteria-1]